MRINNQLTLTASRRLLGASRKSFRRLSVGRALAYRCVGRADKARPHGVLPTPTSTWNVIGTLIGTLVFHVAPLPFQLPAPLLPITRRQFRLGGGGRREAESGETGRDFDGWGGWLEDHRDHGFLHG